MSPSVPDRALRNMVADLAALHADDIAAILDELDAKQRKIIEGLLRDFTSPTGMQTEQPRPPFDASKLSPWLIQRLRAEDRMTEHARQALNDCAKRICPAQEAA